jgi:hypothetical protein
MVNTDLAVPAPAPATSSIWPVSDHSAEPVLDLLSTQGWSLVSTPEANVHATSPDGRVYVGWLPEDPDAWSRHIVFCVHVTPAEGPDWIQEFGLDTPSVAVAGFLSALIDASR